jgi:fluoride exporter
MRMYALAFLCSGLGGVARYTFGRAVSSLLGREFPYGTFVVNLTGCLAIGIAATLLATATVREEYRMAVLAGLIGGYTTFSAFEWETFTLIRSEQLMRACVYVVLSVVAGLAAVWIGHLRGGSRPLPTP